MAGRSTTWSPLNQDDDQINLLHPSGQNTAKSQSSDWDTGISTPSLPATPRTLSPSQSNAQWPPGEHDVGDQSGIQIPLKNGPNPTYHVSSGGFEATTPPKVEVQTTSQGIYTSHYRFERHIRRGLLNTLGPLLVVLFYFFVAFEYLRRPSVNGISPPRIINAKSVFYTSIILSIFLLDWAKSGLAGFEAAALMRRSLAPSNAQGLMWHTDRGWGSISGWWNALAVCLRYFRALLNRRGGYPEWHGPGPLWFYLAFSSFIFYAAVPLAGLSMDTSDSLQLGTRPIVVVGTNQSSFDNQVSVNLGQAAYARWRQGNPTTPEGDTILYAPEGTIDASNTFYEDQIRGIYQKQLESTGNPVNETVSFFSGPQVSERAHGAAWGVLTNLSCMPVHPDKGFELLNITSPTKWYAKTADGYTDSAYFIPSTSGTQPAFASGDNSYGVTWTYVMASDRSILTQCSDYTDGNQSCTINSISQLPIPGSLELMMWQAYDESRGFVPDQTFIDMASHPSVVAYNLTSNITGSMMYLGYGVRCTVDSTVGNASVSPVTNTFSDFQQQPADYSIVRAGTTTAFENPGVMAIQTVVFSAFTTSGLGYLGPPICDQAFSGLCNGWLGANAATQGTPIYIPPRPDPSMSNATTNNMLGETIQYPTIGPERMTLALNKLFGEVAIAMMAAGPGNWTSVSSAALGGGGGLYGLEYASDIVAGRVPYQVVLILLIIWAVITVLPQLLLPNFFLGRRWASALDGFAMFRFGAEWAARVHELRGGELGEAGTASLRSIPGMIGDMRPRRLGGHQVLQTGLVRGKESQLDEPGFVGLSRYEAETDADRIYSFAKAN